MKKVFCLILAVMMIVSLASCSLSTDQLSQALNSALDQVTSEISSDLENDLNGKSGDDANGFDTDLTVDEQVVFDKRDVKITVTGIEFDDFYGPMLNVLIENNSKTDLTFTLDDCYINDYSIYGSLYVDVAAGKKANDEITFSTSEMELAKISSLKKIEASFKAYDENYNDIAKSDLIEIKTSASDSYKGGETPSGEEIFNKDGLQMVITGYEKNGVDDYYTDPTLVVYARNNTKKRVTFSSDDFYVNGFKVDATYYETLEPGKCVVSTVMYYKEYLEKNKIEADDIEELELNISIYDADSYDAIDKIEKAVYKP